ncbi:hypothetical protein [Nanchangia anserum]|uniref:DNA-directed RNA polymerase subunit beta n=1 Tax=Nanchangia anserum TaxID=2692125 RepID=A0A8I0G8B2_9ACTO|nr:hypothetical protein [Nanchangia anserum]MBD3689745.1 hypothetical protein [Nanchangia anserum]
MARAPFRRPAPLDPADAEAIEAGIDVPGDSEVAHASARLLVGHDDSHDLDALVGIIRSGGVDTVCELWSSSPATTLPGILWRLYLIHQWGVRDPDQLAKRYREGIAAPVIPGVAEGVQVGLDETLHAIGALMRGEWAAPDAPPLWSLLARSGVLLRILAAGVTFGDAWITDDTDALADYVTTRARALTRTAEELHEAARRARAGRLD